MLRLALCALVGAGAGACGKIKTVESGPDAAADDTDAGPDGEPGEVTVTVLEQFDEDLAGEPMDDLPVLFFEKDGTFIEETATDSDGVATGTVPPHSIVVVLATIESKTTQTVTLSMFDIQPGDDIVFRSKLDGGGDLTPLGTMDVVAPALDESGGDIVYRATPGCGGGQQADDSTIPSVTFYEECSSSGEVDVIVRAYLSATGEMVNVTSKHDTFVNAGTITIASWHGVDDLEVAVTEVPAEVHIASFTAEQFKDGHTFEAAQTLQVEPDSDAFDVSAGKLDTFGDKLAVSVNFQPTQVNLGGQFALHTIEPDASDLPLPLDEELLPWMGRPAFSEADRRMTWTRVGGSRAPDAQYVYVFGPREDAKESVGWVAVVPPDWTEVTLPDLPDEYDEHEVTGYAAAISIAMGVETNEFDGYDIRRIGLRPFLDFFIDGPPPDLELGSSWRVTLSGGEFD